MLILPLLFNTLRYITHACFPNQTPVYIFSPLSGRWGVGIGAGGGEGGRRRRRKGSCIYKRILWCCKITLQEDTIHYLNDNYTAAAVPIGDRHLDFPFIPPPRLCVRRFSSGHWNRTGEPRRKGLRELNRLDSGSWLVPTGSWQKWSRSLSRLNLAWHIGTRNRRVTRSKQTERRQVNLNTWTGLETQATDLSQRCTNEQIDLISLKSYPTLDLLKTVMNVQDTFTA